MRTTADLAWLAGFLEGDGCFCLQKHRYASVKVSQTSRWPLEVCQRLLGGTIHPRRHNQPNHRPVFYWSIGGPSAAGAMMTLFSFLSPRRREQVKSVLRRWVTVPAKAAMRTHCPKGHPFSGDNLFIRTLKQGHAGRGCRECQRSFVRACRARQKEQIA